MLIKDLITTMHKSLEDITKVDIDTKALEQALITEVESAFALDLDGESIKVEDAYSDVGFRDNYIRLKVGQEAYDQVLESIEADILSQAILEVGQEEPA